MSLPAQPHLKYNTPMKMPHERPRRLRRTPAIRDLHLNPLVQPRELVWPVFITDGTNKQEPIASMPGQFRRSLDELLRELESVWSLGIRAVALFPRIEDSLKTRTAEEAYNPEGLVPRAVRRLKHHFPDLVVITDVALDPYSSDGHDGLVQDGQILNDESISVLARMALCQAQAGADFVAPSDMMDGRVGAIRSTLDETGLTNTGIISYCSKYASCFYGPFREALDSAPKAGDKLSYQMSPRSPLREALREARLDVHEGADILLVKPALAYLDVIQKLHVGTDLPVAAYQVSGEYAMICAAGERGWIQQEAAMVESLQCLRRAGADLIFTYFAPAYSRWFQAQS